MGDLVPRGTNQILNKTRLSGDRISLHFDKKNEHADPEKQVFLTEVADIASEINKFQGRSVSLSGHPHGGPFDISINGSELKSGTVLETINFQRRKEFNLTAISCRQVRISGKCLVLRNVTCLQLTIHLDSSSVRLINCDIGVLEISSTSEGWKTSNLLLEGCIILSLKIPQGFNVRDCIISSCKFATKQEKLIQDFSNNAPALPTLDRASFAFLYDWATRSGNSETAHLSRGIELAIERETSKNRFEKLVLSCWGLFANFGLSPLRPLLWTLLASVVMLVFLFLVGSEHTLAESQLVGWRTLLEGNCLENRVMRSLVGALEGMISPLSAVSPRRLIVPSGFMLTLGQVVYGYFCITMVLLFGFAVRRRFKIG